MGNQQSIRPHHRSNSTVGHEDYCSEQQPSENPYRRQYPFPDVWASEGHIKPRKQSSPCPLASVKSSPSSSRLRFRPLRAFASFRHEPSSSTQMARSASDDLAKHHQQQHEPSSVPIHPLSLPETDITGSEQSTTLVEEGTEKDDARYHWLNGRKFHNAPGSQYMLPCDEEEVDRLHLLHFMVRFAIQGNYLAPVSDILRKGAKVLDVGCGPGTWTMEIAGEYPKSQLIGVDISSMFPGEIRPGNCSFVQCNILDGLPFPDESFDYIFMRFLGLGIQAEQWPNVIADLVRVLKPGGWIELIEVDTEIHRPGPTTKEYNQRLISVMKSRKLDPRAGPLLRERLEQTGQLTHITTTFISCPGGLWAGKLGQLTLQSWEAYYHALGPQICRTAGMSINQYMEGLEACWDEANEYKTFENVHFAYAQKTVKLPS